MSDELDESTHYYRVCTNCGYGWWGLHCPHDGYQNPCSNCDKRPKTLPDELCKCEFVMNVDDFKAYTESQVREILTKLEQRVAYNAHDMGELGRFVRVKYVKNFIDDARSPTKRR